MRRRSGAVPTLPALALTAALVGVLVGCGADSGSSAPVALPSRDPVPPSRVEVDTPELRELKREAGVEPCRAGTAAPGTGILPELSLACLGGGDPVDLSTLEGPLVLNLWQAYCDPCIREMPALQEFHEQYGDRVGVLGVDYLDVRPVAALELVQQTGVTYPLVADPGGDLSANEPFPVVRGLPYLAFLADDGELFVEAGGVETVEELVAKAEQHLGIDL